MADLLTRLLLRTSDFDANLQRSKKQISDFEKRIQKFSNKSGFALKSLAGAAGAVSIASVLSDVNKKTIEFEKSLSSLKALTGLTTQEMAYFKAEAIRLGSTTTQSASQVADAFKVIGSQMPELLKSKMALSNVTEQAIILAEAAGIDVPSASKALTGSLNQMGEGAKYASDYINVLAAASQKGSADIPYLNSAIEKAGGTSSAVGIKFNELVASIEAIAPKVTEASTAGLNLKNIFLTLEGSVDKKLKPSVVGLGNALTYLESKNLDATQMTRMFGKESVSAALALVGAKDNYLNYAESIKGTNTALEQQKINNTNLDGSIKSMSSAWEGFMLTLNTSQGTLMRTTNFTTAILKVITNSLKSESVKQMEATNKLSNNERKALDRRIKSYEDFYDKKTAVEKTMTAYKDENKMGDFGLKDAEIKMQQLEMRAKKYIPKGGFDEFVNGVKPNAHLSYNDISKLNAVNDEIEAHKKLIDEIKIKNDVYKESMYYLQEELRLTEAVKDSNKNSGETEAEEKARKAKAEVYLNFAEMDAERISDWVNKSIYDIQNYAMDGFEAIPLPIGFEIEPELFDLVGSIAEVEQQIQDVTELYNEATTSALRAQYAKRKDELELHLLEMQEANNKLIDVADQLNGLIENAVIGSLSSVGDAIGSGDGGEAMRGMLIGMMDMLKQFGAALVTAGLAKVAFDKLMINPIAAIAAGGALVVAASVAKSKLQSAGSFADGGIIGGNSYSGDRLTANVNSGEMILNNQQQGRLFQLANGVYNHIPLSPPPSFTRDGMASVQSFSDGNNISKILSTENQNRVDHVAVSGVFRVKGQDLEAAIGNRVRYRSRIK